MAVHTHVSKKCVESFGESFGETYVPTQVSKGVDPNPYGIYPETGHTDIESMHLPNNLQPLLSHDSNVVNFTLLYSSLRNYNFPTILEDSDMESLSLVDIEILEVTAPSTIKQNECDRPYLMQKRVAFAMLLIFWSSILILTIMLIPHNVRVEVSKNMYGI